MKLALILNIPKDGFFQIPITTLKTIVFFVILRQAHRRMRIELERAWQSKANDLPYASAYEALIMASIIEKKLDRLVNVNKSPVCLFDAYNRVCGYRLTPQ